MGWYGNIPSIQLSPQKTAAMSAAYDDALQRALSLGFEKDKTGAPVQNAIAGYIIAGARRGMYDPKILAEGAIRYLRRD